jgi:hypothetical protein
MPDPVQQLVEKDGIIDTINRVEVRGNEASAFCYAIASRYRKTKSGRNTRPGWETPSWNEETS